MSLSETKLKKNLTNAFEECMKLDGPGNSAAIFPIPEEVCRLLSSAYDSYAKEAMPAPMTVMVTPPDVSVLKNSLSLPMMAGWAPGLVQYWTTVTWSGPGFIPVNPTVSAPVIGVGLEIATLISSPVSPITLEEFSEKLSSLLHRYTAQMTVAATTVAGVSSIIPMR